MAVKETVNFMDFELSTMAQIFSKQIIMIRWSKDFRKISKVTTILLLGSKLQRIFPKCGTNRQVSHKTAAL